MAHFDEHCRGVRKVVSVLAFSDNQSSNPCLKRAKLNHHCHDLLASLKC